MNTANSDVAHEYFSIDDHGEVTDVWVDKTRSKPRCIAIVDYGSQAAEVSVYTVHAANGHFTEEYETVRDKADALDKVDELKTDWPWEIPKPDTGSTVTVTYDSNKGGKNSFTGTVTDVYGIHQGEKYAVEIETSNDEQYKVTTGEPNHIGNGTFSLKKYVGRRKTRDGWERLGNGTHEQLSWI